MLYFLLTTGKCNLACKYCGGSFPESLVPYRVQYSISDLKKFLTGDKNVVIAFYGGEPLLNPEFISKVMDEVPAKRFVIQTNGLLIDNLKDKYWRRMDAVLLSIDGRREVTNYYRGEGVYEAVVKAAEKLRGKGFKGDLIARMAVSERSDIYLDVTHLLSLGLFDHVHWQLDVVWSNRWRDFDGWVEKSYKPGISKLARLWVEKALEGEVLGIIPFLGVSKAVLTGGIPAPPCEAGINAVAINTNGKVLACPIAVDVKWAVLGDIRENTFKTIRRFKGIGEPCTSCSWFKYCGGRCLYAHIERYWGEEGFRKVCEITIHLIKEVVKALTALRGRIDLKKLIYPEYNNTTEIIP